MAMIMSAVYRRKFEALQGNDDVSVWVKNSRVGRKTPKQTNKDICYIKKYFSL